MRLGAKTDLKEGTYFVVAEWKQGSFVDPENATAFSSEREARDERDRRMAGTTKTVRYTVFGGFVTTRTQLRN